VANARGLSSVSAAMQPCPDLSRLWVRPSFWDAPARWATDLSGSTHPDEWTRDGSPRWRWPEKLDFSFQVDMAEKDFSYEIGSASWPEPTNN
jgi:hypothetical protein